MAKVQNNTVFRRKLRDCTRAAGLWIQDHADEIVPEVDGLRSYTIRFDFDSVDGIPEISIDADYTSMDMIKALYPGNGPDGN